MGMGMGLFSQPVQPHHWTASEANALIAKNKKKIDKSWKSLAELNEKNMKTQEKLWRGRPRTPAAVSVSKPRSRSKSRSTRRTSKDALSISTSYDVLKANHPNFARDKAFLRRAITNARAKQPSRREWTNASNWRALEARSRLEAAQTLQAARIAGHGQVYALRDRQAEKNVKQARAAYPRTYNNNAYNAYAANNDVNANATTRARALVASSPYTPYTNDAYNAYNADNAYNARLSPKTKKSSSSHTSDYWMRKAINAYEASNLKAR